MNWKYKTVLCSLVFFFLSALPSFAQNKMQEGTVIKVKDGDSMVIRTKNGKKLQTRLYGIDAPEWKQNNSDLARNYLRKKFLNKKVRFSVKEYDRYNRAIARVWHGKTFINEILIAKGLVWVHPYFCKTSECKTTFYPLEKAARKKRIGIWQEENPIKPWDWKKQKKKNRS